MSRNFAKRETKEFNKFRLLCQKMVCTFVLNLCLRMYYRIECKGIENLEKEEKFILASNHISNWDPFILAGILNKTPLAFMAKKELFEKFFSRTIMDWCGAFAVNREKVEVATLKTALSLKNTSWNLGIFPQGTRQKFGSMVNVNKGFATLAKATKTNILPIAIIKKENNNRKILPFLNRDKIIIKIGNSIPYSDNVDDMLQQWINSINKLIGIENVTN